MRFFLDFFSRFQSGTDHPKQSPRSGSKRDRVRSRRQFSQTQFSSEQPSQKLPSQKPLKRRSPLVLLLLLLFWSVILGMGLAQARVPVAGNVSGDLSGNRSRAFSEQTIAQVTTPDPAGLVDPVSENYQLGQELYLENCASCHVGLPPATMPTESWREILTKPYHYGVDITPLVQPALQIAWNYVSFYSRPLQEGENPPFRLRSSRYFKVLHPKVSFSEPVTVRSCIACHPAAEQFNYRSLIPEWENAP